MHEGLKDFGYSEWTGLQDGVVGQRWPEERRALSKAFEPGQPMRHFT